MSSTVSVHSFRGGTGKSNVTANLAVTIALRGKRVGIVDTDIQSPGIHVLFELDEQKIAYSLNDYLWGKCTIVQAAHDVTGSLEQRDGADFQGGKLYLVPSSIKTGEITKVLREGYDVRLLNEGFRALVRELSLDFLFIDTHPGLNEETLLSIAISNLMVIILRPDQQDFQGTAVTVEVARKLDVPRTLLVVNKALADFDFDALRKRVESTYDTTVAGVLPLSEDVVRLASAGVFCLRYPAHQFSSTIGAIADQVLA